MTRKRFIKLLMAKGYSRNAANELADEVLERGMGYESAYIVATVYVPTIGDEGWPKVLAAVENLGVVMGRTVRAIGVGVDAFVEAYTNAMKETEEERAC